MAESLCGPSDSHVFLNRRRRAALFDLLIHQVENKCFPIYIVNPDHLDIGSRQWQVVGGIDFQSLKQYAGKRA
jgi:hypothetical protein